MNDLLCQGQSVDVLDVDMRKLITTPLGFNVGLIRSFVSWPNLGLRRITVNKMIVLCLRQLCNRKLAHHSAAKC